MPAETLEDAIVAFIGKYGPKRLADRRVFIADLRTIMEAYGKNAIIHGDLPDTDHPHRFRPEEF